MAHKTIERNIKRNFLPLAVGTWLQHLCLRHSYPDGTEELTLCIQPGFVQPESNKCIRNN